MGRLRTLFQGLIVLTLVVAVAWHVEGFMDDPTERAFQDADRRLRGEGPGERKTEVQGIVFEVPSGTAVLRVGSILDVEGSLKITMVDPHGKEHVERLDGDTFSKNCCWKRIPRPHPGTWDVDVRVSGTGAYALGFYFEDK